MAERKFILRNRQNYNDKKVLTFGEFKREFSNELRTAISIYTHHEEQRDMIKPPCMVLNRNYTSDFYASLRFNFNNNAPTQWYIDQIL